MIRKLAALGFALALFGAVLVPNARADEGNQEMVVNIKNGPVELPGRVLAPGKYDMKFATQENDVLEVTTAGGRHPIGFFEVIPVTRAHLSDRPKLEISEAQRGSVARLTEFFYPDRMTGYKFEFSHPKRTASVNTTQGSFASR